MQWVTLYCNFSFTITVYTDDYRAETRDHKQLSTAAELTAQVMSKVRVHPYKTHIQLVLSTSPPSLDHSWRYCHLHSIRHVTLFNAWYTPALPSPQFIKM